MMTPDQTPQRVGPAAVAVGSRRDLDVQLIVALVVALAALITFIALAAQVTHHGSLTLLDTALMLDFHAAATARGSMILGIFTAIGSPEAVGLVGLVGIVAISVRRERIVAVGWAVALGGGAVIDEVVKHAIARPRPPFAVLHLTHLSYSFPSGHSLGSLIGYGMLAYVVLLSVPRRDVQLLVVILVTLLVLAVGFSRLYLGVHYFSDVLGGYASGACWLCVCVTATDVARRRAVWRRARAVASVSSAP